MDRDDEARAELKSDLNAIAESVSADARRLREIELEKTRLRMDDPRLAELAREAERLGQRLATTSKVESALVAEVQDRRDESEPAG